MLSLANEIRLLLFIPTYTGYTIIVYSRTNVDLFASNPFLKIYPVYYGSEKIYLLLAGILKITPRFLQRKGFRKEDLYNSLRKILAFGI